MIAGLCDCVIVSVPVQQLRWLEQLQISGRARRAELARLDQALAKAAAVLPSLPSDARKLAKLGMLGMEAPRRWRLSKALRSAEAPPEGSAVRQKSARKDITLARQKDYHMAAEASERRQRTAVCLPLQVVSIRNDWQARALRSAAQGLDAKLGA